MSKKEDIGFGKPVNVDSHDYLLMWNLWGDWWIACEDKAGNAAQLSVVKYPVLDNDWQGL
jgi:hypothetical protein